MRNEETLAVVFATGLLGYALWQFLQGNQPITLPSIAPPTEPPPTGGQMVYPEQPTEQPYYQNEPPYYQENTPMPPTGNMPIIQTPTQGVSYDTDILARTLYGEARGEPDVGKQGVGSVIRNRMNDGRWPRSLAGVCLAQHGTAGYHDFSCWNPSDPNYSRLLYITIADRAFASCLAMAQKISANSLPDNTKGANYYHDTSIATPSAWRSFTPTVQIGRLLFFRDGGNLVG